VEVARPNATASTVEQRFYGVTDDDKRRVIKQILKQRELSQAIVFVNSKLGAARLARSFERDGLRTAALHGDKSQDERLKSLAAFKAGEVDLLVATDVAARGLDIADLPAVFNFDVPFNAEDYVHRIGRTGRAGASGLAVTLVDRDDNRLVADCLEADWNTALRALVQAQEHYEHQRHAEAAGLTEAQRASILALAQDFPRLWNDPQTPDRERKRMARLLIVRPPRGSRRAPSARGGRGRRARGVRPGPARPRPAARRRGGRPSPRSPTGAA
jgi:superfamily II DNA/RNA helicase